jgi:hypothetical protein
MIKYRYNRIFVKIILNINSNLNNTKNIYVGKSLFFNLLELNGHIHTMFIVRVPVLSLHIVVAEPIVSHADKCLT